MKLQQGKQSKVGYLRVGDLARKAGKTVRALHLYEEMGLLRPTTRSKGRFRLYRPESLVRVSWIGKLQDIGFSLPEIQMILQGWHESDSAPRAMASVRDLYVRKLNETRAQRHRLQALESELEESLRYLDTCQGCDTARVVTACPSCDVHACDDRPTELIAGLHTH